MNKCLFNSFILMLITAFVLCGCGDGSGGTAFSVNNIEVSKEELIFYMRRSSDVVIADAETNYGLDVTKDGFWNEPMGDKTPLDVLKQTAIKEIIRSKVMLSASEKYGAEVQLTYSEQQAAWKKDNDERQRKEKNGEMLYGATLRSFYTYLSLVSSETENKLKSGLKDDKIITVSDREIKEYYSSHPEYFTGDNSDFESNESAIFTWIFNEKFEDYLDTLVKNASVEDIDMTVNTDLLN